MDKSGIATRPAHLKMRLKFALHIRRTQLLKLKQRPDPNLAPNGRGEGVQETEVLKVIQSVKLGAVGTTGTLAASSVF